LGASTEESVFFQRVEYILDSIEKGIKRDKIALTLGYTNPKSLDIFMRRKGFVYDKGINNYTPVKTSELKDTKTYSEDKRLNSILSLFSREDADSRKVAQLTGFNSHIELAEFMKSNNYDWNEACGNYIRLRNSKNISSEENEKNKMELNELHEYIPLLRQLYKDKDKLLRLMASQSDISTIQEYILNGLATFITISINEKLNNLIKQFSTEKVMKTDKILETALIEFLIKYGFDSEVNELLVP
jgi:hypothetical protein